MKKLPNHLDGPVDNWIIDVVEYTTPFFYNIGFTPNGITTLSLLMGLLSIGQFRISNYWSAAVFYFLSYYFDCADGYMARKYKMVTNFGDYYDHVKDILIGGILIYMLWVKYSEYNATVRVIMLIAILVLLYMSLMYLGCQEIYYNRGNESSSLNFATSFCPIDKTTARTVEEADISDILLLTRFFSPATFTLWICFMMILCGYLDPV
jgi:phosphatidylglycerophosphate synthase